MLEIDILPGYDGVSEGQLRIGGKKFASMPQWRRNSNILHRWNALYTSRTARAGHDVNA
jgi:hypothetical protein